MSLQRTAIYPGTFDPITMGHLSIIKRAAAMFDKLTVGIAKASSKVATFSAEARKNMVVEAVHQLVNVEVKIFDGLLVDFTRQQQSKILIRGLRAVSDFEYEFTMAWINHRLAPEIETIFLTSSEETQFISSRLVKEIISLKGSFEEFVPESVINYLKNNPDCI